MSLWWSIAPMTLIGGFGLLALVAARIADELERLDASLVRLERTGVGVDALRRDVALVRERVHTRRTTRPDSLRDR